MALPSARRAFWKNLPLRSRVLFLLGVALLFSIIGFVNNIMNLGQDSTLRLAVSGLLFGFFGGLYALIGFRLGDRVRMALAIVPVFAVQAMAIKQVERWLPNRALPVTWSAADIARLSHSLEVSGIATILAMALGYSCFAVFARTEGKRHYLVQAEMDLAAEIHQVLVPPVSARIGNFEFYGRSQPSGEVGGDLIDVVEGGDGWAAYIADVSGHGVAPGVVMGMVKSAARMQLTWGGGSAQMLRRLNSVLYPLKKPNMFVTMAYLAGHPEGLEYALAGHPPILHYHAASGRISELECPNLPVGIMEENAFEVRPLAAAPGDLFVLLTDGLLEMENKQGEEFGLAGVKAELARHAGEPLEQVWEAIAGAARDHGKPADDQSLLLVRRGSRQEPAASRR